MDIKLEIELFTVEYLRFIFSDFWIFIGFCIMILLLQGLGKVYYVKFIGMIGLIKTKYKKNITMSGMKEKFIDKNKPDIL